MKTVQLTQSKHLIPYANFLTKNGEPVECLLLSAGLPSTCLAHPKTPLPTASLWRFRELVAHRTGLPNLTLNVVADLEFAQLGAIAHAVLGQPTLLQMVQTFTQLARTESSTATLDIQQGTGEGVYFVDQLALRHAPGEWHAELYVLLWMLKIVQLVAPTWSPAEIWCVSKGTPDRVRAIESLGAKPHFGECCTSFLIPASMLALPPKHGESVPRDRAPKEEDFWATAPSRTFSGAVKQLIRAYTADGWLSIEDASKIAGTSTRTMQRRLSLDATTYSDLREEVRGELAGNLLENSDAPMSEVAAQLGYTDQANFTRAFRRWAGVPPTVFRAQRRALPA